MSNDTERRTETTTTQEHNSSEEDVVGKQRRYSLEMEDSPKKQKRKEAMCTTDSSSDVNEQKRSPKHANRAQSLVHQTDRSGTQQRAKTSSPARQSRPGGQSRPSNALASALCCLFGCCGTADTHSIVDTSRSQRPGGSYVSPSPATLLGPRRDACKKTLVLDLDETLVHSTFQPTTKADIVLPISIEGVVYKVYVRKRPGATEFIDRMSKSFEVVVFTASLQKYADPLLDLIDKNRVLRGRLFRRHCSYVNGSFVKDLSTLDRDMENVLLVDNSPLSYSLQPANGVPCSSFIDDPEDAELEILAPYLEKMANVPDVRRETHVWKAAFRRLYNEAPRSSKIETTAAP